ncbi:DUF1749 domain-containing protein [Candidatus Gottesmanbacteria bacterium]|nr:DUF1749 domain-containing protein [Candidatus Gottesmanbacteria bacterium]
MKKLVKEKPEKLVEGIDYMPVTPKRFLSLYVMDSAEDVFPYYQKSPAFSVFSKIRKPLMVIMAGSDEYADRPVEEIVDVYKKYQRSHRFQSSIIPGAFHSYGGKEKKFVEIVTGWVKTIK